MSRGYTTIVAPGGEVLAGPILEREQILYADLDMDTVHAQRRMFDPLVTMRAPMSSRSTSTRARRVQSSSKGTASRNTRLARHSADCRQCHVAFARCLRKVVNGRCPARTRRGRRVDSPWPQRSHAARWRRHTRVVDVICGWRASNAALCFSPRLEPGHVSPQERRGSTELMNR